MRAIILLLLFITSPLFANLNSYTNININANMLDWHRHSIVWGKSADLLALSDDSIFTFADYANAMYKKIYNDEKRKEIESISLAMLA